MMKDYGGVRDAEKLRERSSVMEIEVQVNKQESGLY